MNSYTDKSNRQIFKYDEKIGHKYIENIETRILNEKGGYFLKTNCPLDLIYFNFMIDNV